MDIGLYFGSFNPIHTGHLIIANQVINKTNFAEIWFVVTPQNPFKKTIHLLEEGIRLNLTRLAVDDNPLFKVSDIEFDLPKPSYTIDTLAILKEKYPAHKFSIIMGSDNYNNIQDWKKSQDLLNQYQVLVYERPLFELPATSHPNVTFLKVPLLQISSTEIRGLIQENKSFRYLVSEKVWKNIIEKGYYKDLQEPS